MVAVHGLRGRADWSCRIARHVIRARAYVVCPEGTPAPALRTDGEHARFTFATPRALELEIEAALAALARAHADADTTRLLYYGHSLGASYAVAMLRASPARWTRVVMSEGGWGGWWPTPAAHAAGQRVLFACGTAECSSGATASARALATGRRDAGVPAKVVYVEGAGHHSYGPIVDAVSGELDWLVEGDERF